MRKGKTFVALLTGVVVCICTAPLSAALISGTSTATQITDSSPYKYWYLYVIEFDWELDGPETSVSHWDVILKTGCGSLDHLIEFDIPAGYSTSENHLADPMALGWLGKFEREGDPGNTVTDPVVKYNEPYSLYGEEDEPGSVGYGTFSFYANIIPEYEGPYEDALFAKYGQNTIYGELTGAYPSCTIIPEPATICLLGLGGLALLRKRRV